MASAERAPIAVSMGDPAGVGLELTARVWSERRGEAPPFFLIGDSDALTRAAQRAKIAAPPLRVLNDVKEIAVSGDARCVLETPLALQETPGAPDYANSSAVIEAIAKGVEAVRAGAASALVTQPIAKAALYKAGFEFAGHTEYLAHLTEKDAWSGARGPVMLLAGPSLKVALVTIHTPLKDVAKSLSVEKIVRCGKVLNDALQRDFGIAAPRIALCGLNPHAGEEGEIGREEIEIVNPAAALLRAENVMITNARPTDTMFHEEARAGYDAAIALYHDQGLGPLKTLHFWDAVNVTLGLPIVRTSPDHGAAFDIAGKGLARADSFIAALKMADEMARRRAAA